MNKTFLAPALTFFILLFANVQAVIAQVPRPMPTSNGWVDSGSTVRLQTDSDSVGIGTRTPTQKLEVDGGLRLNTADVQPVCDPQARGTLWFNQSNVVAGGDTLQACKFFVDNVSMQNGILPSKRYSHSCAEDSLRFAARIWRNSFS